MEPRPDTALADHIIAFGRVLRRAGVRVASTQIMDALRAVEIVGVERRDDAYQALFGVFVQRRADIELFDQAFALFWRAPGELPGLMQQLLPDSGAPPPEQPRDRVQQALREPKNQPRPDREATPPEAVDVEVVLAYSEAEAFREKDFAEFTADEIARAREAIRRMEWPFEPRRVRRYASRETGRRLDVRRTIRSSLRRYGEVVELRFQGPKTKPRPVVVLCDVSGSMEPYARMLLHFMHTVTEGLGQVESFVFGTRLTRVTRALRRRDVDEALDAVADEVRDWGGGTRTGEALKAFNFDWLRRTLRSEGVALVISDGCDRGDIELLRREMARLARSCHRILWLNPLLRYHAYEPLTRGMQAALPYIDDFLPVHNLASLEQIGAVLTAAARRSGPSWRRMYDWELQRGGKQPG